MVFRPWRLAVLGQFGGRVDERRAGDDDVVRALGRPEVPSFVAAVGVMATG